MGHLHPVAEKEGLRRGVGGPCPPEANHRRVLRGALVRLHLHVMVVRERSDRVSCPTFCGARTPPMFHLANPPESVPPRYFLVSPVRFLLLPSFPSDLRPKQTVKVGYGVIK